MKPARVNYRRLAEADREQDIKSAPEKIRDEMLYELRLTKTHAEKLLKLVK